MLKTRSQRRFFCGLILGFSCVTLALAFKMKGPPVYSPQAPQYRQKGDPASAVVVVEYSDFQCPACSAANIPMERLMSLYGSGVRLIFKHNPLGSIHPKAVEAARFAECAGRQGGFWPYQDALFKNQAEWSKADDPEPFFLGYAKALQLDLMELSRCVKDPSVTQAIEEDRKDARRRFVSATPTFFVNGKRFVGARQLSERGTLEVERILTWSQR